MTANSMETSTSVSKRLVVVAEREGLLQEASHQHERGASRTQEARPDTPGVQRRSRADDDLVKWSTFTSYEIGRSIGQIDTT